MNEMTDLQKNGLLDAMAAQATHFVDSLAAEEGGTDSLWPLALVVNKCEDASISLIVTPFDECENVEQRGMFLMELGADMFDHGMTPLAIFTQAEIWTIPLDALKRSRKFGRKRVPRPSEHPDRVEAVSISGLTPDGEMAVILFSIQRDGEGKIVRITEYERYLWRHMGAEDHTVLEAFFAGYVRAAAESVPGNRA